MQFQVCLLCVRSKFVICSIYKAYKHRENEMQHFTESIAAAATIAPKLTWVTFKFTPKRLIPHHEILSVENPLRMFVSK